MTDWTIYAKIIMVTMIIALAWLLLKPLDEDED